MRAVWSSGSEDRGKLRAFCYVCRAENARSDARSGPAAARCPERSTSSASAFRQPASHRRNSDFGPSPLRACGANTAEPHIRSPLLAAAPKFLIPEVIELYRRNQSMAASFSQDIMRSAPPSSREGWSSLARRLVFVCCAPRQAAFIAAPSGISPWVTQRQRAIRSFRASATIVTRRTRPRS